MEFDDLSQSGIRRIADFLAVPRSIGRDGPGYGAPAAQQPGRPREEPASALVPGTEQHSELGAAG